MKYFYVTDENTGYNVDNEGLQADERGGITLIVLKDSFIMDKFVIDVYAQEILGLDVYCLFEIDPGGIFGEFVDSHLDNTFADFYKILMQPFIQTTHLKRVPTDRYESMGLAPGVQMVENQEKFNDEYKEKILGYYKELD